MAIANEVPALLLVLLFVGAFQGFTLYGIWKHHQIILYVIASLRLAGDFLLFVGICVLSPHYTRTTHYDSVTVNRTSDQEAARGMMWVQLIVDLILVALLAAQARLIDAGHHARHEATAGGQCDHKNDSPPPYQMV